MLGTLGRMGGRKEYVNGLKTMEWLPWECFKLQNGGSLGKSNWSWDELGQTAMQRTDQGKSDRKLLKELEASLQVTCSGTLFLWGIQFFQIQAT